MTPSRRRQANPNLGAYFGIVASAFVSLVVGLAMFEQLGWQQTSLAQAMILVPLVLYLGIAFGARTLNVEDFFVSGRRVPPVYNGAVLSAVLIGGTGFFGYTGTLFFLGFDALAIGLAWTTGLLVSGLLFVPYLRKSGAYTLPGFFGHRFRSRSIRAMASVLQLPPVALLLAAEIKIAALIAAMFLPLSYTLAVFAVVVMIAAITIVGGMRSLTWSASAEFIVSAIGFAVPLIIVAVMLTNLPAPQLTYGEMFEPLQRSETIAGIAPSAPGDLATALPTEQPRPSAKPFLQAFGAIDRTDFLTLFLCLTLGTAALPSLLARSGVTSSVGDQRRSVAWGAFFVALFAISAPALAAFVKLLMFQDIAQVAGERAASLAQRAHRAPSALCPRRQCRRRHRGVGAPRRARRYRAGAADGGAAALRLHRADGRSRHGDRACRSRLPSLHPRRQRRRRRAPPDRSAERDAAAADGGVGGDRRDGAQRRRVSRPCRYRRDAGRHQGLCLGRGDLLPGAASCHLVAALLAARRHACARLRLRGDARGNRLRRRGHRRTIPPHHRWPPR